MTGVVVFIVSPLYGGSASGIYITKHCCLINMLQKKDTVMFLICILISIRKELYCPPFLSATNMIKIQFTRSQVEFASREASARIHVERKMEQIKNIRIFQEIMSKSLSGMADSIFFVYSSLTNLLPALLK